MSGPERRTNTFETSWKPLAAALLAAYGVSKKGTGKFFAKITNAQKLGLLGVSPGKGVALVYNSDLMHRVVFAAEAFEFELAPSTVVGLVRSLWDTRLRKVFADAERAAMREASDDDIIMHMGGVRLMTADWAAAAVPNVNSCPLGKLPDHVTSWMTMGGTDDPGGLPPRALIVNLSSRLRRFHSEFARSNMDELVAQRRAELRARKRRV